MRPFPLALLALLAAGACGGEPSAPPPRTFELRAVVAPAVAALPPAAMPEEHAPPLDVDALEELLGPMRSGDPDLRALAVEDARRIGAPAVPGLAAALADDAEDDGVRLGCAHALGAIATPAALEALLACTQGTGPAWLRTQCADRIGRAGRDELVPRLLLRLKYEKDPVVVYWLADALARLGNLAAVDALYGLWTTSQDEELLGYVAYRLNELAAEHGAETADELRARRDAGALASDREPSAALRDEGWRWIERLGAYDLRTVDDARFVLVRLEPWIVPLLAAALHDETVHVRLHAAQCLARRGPRARAAADELLAALAEPRIAAVAAEALGALGDPRAAAALEEALATSPDAELRVAAARALSRLAQPSSRPVLQQAFALDRPMDLRQAAAEALLALDAAAEARAFLAGCLEDPRADGGAAEIALEAWLARRAADDPGYAEALDRWRVLAGDPARIPDRSEQAARRARRAALVRGLPD